MNNSPGKNKPGNDGQDAFESELTPNTKSSVISGTLHELAGELAYNYFSNSFGDDYNMGIVNCDDIFKKFISDANGGTVNVKSFKERFAKKERVRNIMIIGSGACYDTYRALPTGTELIEEIKAVYENDIKAIPFLKSKFDQVEEEIKEITGKDSLNFENYLYLLSKLFVTQTDLRAKIKEMVGFRHPVSLFNEIVAHLLKHAFLDVVVNFNFEETLDQVIDDEIGSANYQHIISDGNCVEINNLIVDGRLTSPVYIKPHGTYSHKSTLRFTNQHYFDLPNDIKRMLQGLFAGHSGNKKEIQRINVIMVGFAAQSVEFNRILDEKLPCESVFYHIDFKPATDGDSFFSQEPFFFKNFVKRAAGVRRLPADLYKPLCTAGFNKPGNTKSNNLITTPLGELFTVLWRVQNNFFKKPYKPRSIARHEITSYLFYIPELGFKNQRLSLKDRITDREFMHTNIETHPKYFRNRVLVEIFILLNRSNGILDIAEILKGRVGMFYNKYIEACNLKPNTIRGVNTIYELINEFAKFPAKEPKCLQDIPEYSFGKNIFILQSEFVEDDIVDNNAFELKIKEILELLSVYFNNLNIPAYTNLESVRLSELEAEFKVNLKSILDNWLNYIKEKNDSPIERLKLGRTITLFYRLIKSELVSNFFKLNFLLNSGKTVYNGKKQTKNDVPFLKNRQIMLSELFRLLAKSWSHHYFVIDPGPSNPVHHLWESFSSRKVIHTNLSRTASFNHLLLNLDWDIYLSTTETGSSFNFLHHLSYEEKKKLQAKLAKKIFVIICSYESIRQLYPDHYDKKKVLSEHKHHLQGEIAPGEHIISDENLTLLVLPFNQHNHHFSIFLQALKRKSSYTNLKSKFTLIADRDINKPGEKINYLFNAIGSVYFYRSGFSNSIDPIYIGIADQETTTDKVYRDQVKLIDAYVTHLNRSFKYEHFERAIGDNYWPKPEIIYDLQDKWEKHPDKALAKEDLMQALYAKV